MNLARLPRAGDLVRPGAGGWPPSRLRAFESVDSDPSGVLARPAGSVAYLRSGGAAWQNVDGTVGGWVATSVLGAVVSAWSAGGRLVTRDTAVLPVTVAAWEWGGLDDDLDSPIELDLALKSSATANVQLNVIVNGATLAAPVGRAGFSNTQNLATGGAVAGVIGNFFNVDDVVDVSIRVPRPRYVAGYGYRRVEARSLHYNVVSGIMYGYDLQAWLVPLAPLASVGVAASAGGGVVAGGIATLLRYAP